MQSFHSDTPEPASSTFPSMTSSEAITRWRLILGDTYHSEHHILLCPELQEIDHVLEQLYQPEKNQKGGLGSSRPAVARWLGDIRTYFPATVVQIMQQDAFDRLGLHQMLLEPEMLRQVEPDIQLIGTLLSLKNSIPDKTKATAREVVRKVADAIEQRLAQKLTDAIKGSLNRSLRNRRPRHGDIDWHQTIKANLKNFQSKYRTVIPEKLIGFGRSTRQNNLKDIIICLDQSGSMAESVVYASILAAVMATIKSVNTHLVVFDTSVVDLTDKLSDPVDVLFGTQLGGGTDIHAALSYCRTLIRQPTDTVFLLISDLFEGGDSRAMLKVVAELKIAGVDFIALLALADTGAPSFDRTHAQAMATLCIPAFACTPDQFPDLMTAALQKRDIFAWAAKHQIVTAATENTHGL